MKASLRQQFERLAHAPAELDATPRRPGDRRRHEALSRADAASTPRPARWSSCSAASSSASATSPSAQRAARRVGGDADDGRDGARGDRRPPRPTSRALARRSCRPRCCRATPTTTRNAFLEIRAGTGGDESALFAADLARMYLRYAERQGWRTEVMSESASDLGGYKEVVLPRSRATRSMRS